MKTNRILIILLIVGSLLLIPFTAMQVSEEVVWSTFDFLVAGILLMLTGLAINLVWRKFISTKKRILFCGILVALFVIWAELGVGIFGTPFAGN
ncbi:hypothetical protein [Christiangramia sediminis]|uniref:Uncharacterized protein n=1 Tax=Christiangramia sediminis TaxID=2881336 RepID=A0A9X1LIW0_9FLAO|nr:hypothetical protein [Christiangramia sediminis]MCB7481019.1 hypothetical protein [Christiangramia sediminis]